MNRPAKKKVNMGLLGTIGAAVSFVEGESR